MFYAETHIVLASLLIVSPLKSCLEMEGEGKPWNCDPFLVFALIDLKLTFDSKGGKLELLQEANRYVLPWAVG